ncbi:hypothetical protein HPB49_000743 [Dermacentor silvarum]|uniref:Uncharacterized protein n=1 Tax=Dermacentor silvarum TaxID=543639 RepID=A0ACB8CIS9_DERSI|nr:hypothetical protein HPB49_000743 [Dermacentor silvarum]
MTDANPGPALRTQALDETPRDGDKALLGPVQPEFMCWSAILVAAVGLTVWLLRHALHRESDESPPPPSTPGFYCEKIVIKMSRRANRTIDACNNFLDYACYHRDGLAEATEQLFRAEGLSPTKAAVNDVTDMFSRWSGGTDFPVVDTAGILEIKYGISLTFSLRLDLKTNKKSFTAEVYPTLQYGSSGNMKQKMYRALIDHSISVVNERLGVNVTRKRIAELRLRLNNASGTADDTETLEGGFELLGQLFPNASLDKWPLHMIDVCSYNCSDTVVVTVKDANVIRTVFDILGLPHFHAQSLAYLVVETTAALFEREPLFDNISGKGTALWTEFCDTDTIRLFELWDLVSVHQFTNQERDDALRSLYDSISGAVVADATDIFASPEDAKEAQTLVSRMRLLLPAQVSNWYQLFLPNLTEDYCTNVTAVRAFRRKTWLYAAVRGFSDLSWTREIGLDAYVIPLEDAIAVSPILYADIRVKACRETYITAALVGVQLASALWLALFEHFGWNEVVSELLDRHSDCLQGQISHEDPTNLLYPALSLRSTVRAVAGAGWHRALRMWSLWYMSPSSLFYMLFYVRYICHRHEGLELLPRSTNFMRRLPDFCAAFRCQPLPRLAKCVHDLRVTLVAV